MKRIVVLSTLLLFSYSIYAAGIKTRMRPQDRFIIEAFVDLWQNIPAEIESGSLDRGVSINYLYDYPIGLTNFSIAAGFNYTSHNYYTSSHIYTREDNSAKFDFIKIPDDIKVDKSKVSLNYIGIPVELRFFARNLPKTLRVHAGFKTGYLVSAYNKYEGRAIDGHDFDVKFREYKLSNIDNIFYGISGRVGYGRVNVYGFFPLKNVFSDNSVEDMVPISLGLSFILF